MKRLAKMFVGATAKMFVGAPKLSLGSYHATHGTGSLPATVAPPATEGFSAVRFVLMFSDGTPAPFARS